MQDSVNDLEIGVQNAKSFDSTLQQFEATVQRIKEREEEYEKQIDDIRTKQVQILLTFIVVSLLLAFTVLDMYFAYNDNSCMHNDAVNTKLNFYNYLMGSGFILSITFGCILFVTCFDTKCGGEGAMIVFAWGHIFLVAWNLFGAILFWDL